MGQDEKKRSFGIINIAKLWVIRFLIGSFVAISAKKIDSYLDKKYGASDYDKKIVQMWDTIKGIF